MSVKSKALKESYTKKLSLYKETKKKSKLASFFETISYEFKQRIYYPITGFFTGLFNTIERMYSYAKFSKDNFDFDFGYTYKLLAFKLDRLYNGLKYGVAIHNKEDMEALKECIKICNRLSEDSYDEKYHKIHDKKWGKLSIKFFPIEDGSEDKPRLSRVESKRSKAKTTAQKNKERKEFLKCYEMAEKDRLADLDKLHELIKKHSKAWWD